MIHTLVSSSRLVPWRECFLRDGNGCVRVCVTIRREKSFGHLMGQLVDSRIIISFTESRVFGIDVCLVSTCVWYDCSPLEGRFATAISRFPLSCNCSLRLHIQFLWAWSCPPSTVWQLRCQNRRHAVSHWPWYPHTGRMGFAGWILLYADVKDLWLGAVWVHVSCRTYADPAGSAFYVSGLPHRTAPGVLLMLSNFSVRDYNPDNLPISCAHFLLLLFNRYYPLLYCSLVHNILTHHREFSDASLSETSSTTADIFRKASDLTGGRKFPLSLLKKFSHT